jgi:hypothetical protein
MNAPKPSLSAENQTAPKTSQTVSSGISTLIRLCAIGLLVSFFLPWIQFMGQGPSGFDLQKSSGDQKWLWIIPVFSVITIFIPALTRYQKIAALLTGALPFCVLAYWLSQLGSELLHSLGLGGWLSLFCGLALLILPLCLKTKSPKS